MVYFCDMINIKIMPMKKLFYLCAVTMCMFSCYPLRYELQPRLNTGDELWSYRYDERSKYECLTDTLIFSGRNKEDLFYRSMLWVNTPYKNLFSSVDYSDFESGVIITKITVPQTIETVWLKNYGGKDTVTVRHELDVDVDFTVVMEIKDDVIYIRCERISDDYDFESYHETTVITQNIFGAIKSIDSYSFDKFYVDKRNEAKVHIFGSAEDWNIPVIELDEDNCNSEYERKLIRDYNKMLRACKTYTFYHAKQFSDFVEEMKDNLRMIIEKEGDFL